MTVLKSLVVYWLKDGGEDNFLVPPLEDILNPKNQPPPQWYPAYVNLFAASLQRDQNDVVGINMPATISKPLDDGVGKELQDKGIKVVLSILCAPAVGWSNLTAEENTQLVAAIGHIKTVYNIDGIDIDDEYGPNGTPQNFYDTVHAIRSAFPDLVISNAIYAPDEDHYSYPGLADLMTYCATMNYGNDCNAIIELVQTFNNLGMPMKKLYAGVKPGPLNCEGAKDSFTSIEVSEQVAEWAKTNCAGVMIFTYSTDTVEYADCPQKSGWPNPKDHAWQKAITGVLTAKNLYVVNYLTAGNLTKYVGPQDRDEEHPPFKVTVGPRSFKTVTTQQVTGALPWQVTANPSGPYLSATNVESLPAVIAFEPPHLTAVAYSQPSLIP
jgi:hypothetical protein